MNTALTNSFSQYRVFPRRRIPSLYFCSPLLFLFPFPVFAREPARLLPRRVAFDSSRTLAKSKQGAASDPTKVPCPICLLCIRSVFFDSVLFPLTFFLLPATSLRVEESFTFRLWLREVLCYFRLYPQSLVVLFP